MKKDPVEAYVWYDLASKALESPELQSQAIAERERIAAEMPPDERAKAQSLAELRQGKLRETVTFQFFKPVAIVGENTP